MLILRDTDPSLLCRSLMPGVPETAGKTVRARRSVPTMGIGTLRSYCVVGVAGVSDGEFENCSRSWIFYLRSKGKIGFLNLDFVLQRSIRRTFVLISLLRQLPVLLPVFLTLDIWVLPGTRLLIRYHPSHHEALATRLPKPNSTWAVLNGRQASSCLFLMQTSPRSKVLYL